MMRRDEAVPAACDVLRASHRIPNFLECLADDCPRSPVVVSLKVSDVFEENISRKVFLDDDDNVVKECAACLVLEPLLPTRFRERLTRKSCTQNVVIRNF